MLGAAALTSGRLPSDSDNGDGLFGSMAAATEGWAAEGALRVKAAPAEATADVEVKARL